MRLTLPLRVLISPLCARNLLGCARSQFGNVLVENLVEKKVRFYSKPVMFFRCCKNAKKLSFLIEGQHLLGKINLMQKYDECYSKHKFYAKHSAY